MTPKRKQRALIIIGIVVASLAAFGLFFYASNKKMNFYYSPYEIQEGKAPLNRTIRVGGLVAPNSLIKSTEKIDVNFDVIDGKYRIHVVYDKMLPDLFREGQGVIVTGILLDEKNFKATEVLAKHDEAYMPPEVTQGLKESGHPSSIPIPNKTDSK